MPKRQNDEDIFLEFIIKEKELAEIEKYHAQTTIKYMAKCYKEKEDNSTIINKLFNIIRDFFMGFKLKFIKFKNDFSLKNITEDDKLEKVITHKIYEKRHFKIHYIVLRIFQHRILIDDCGGVDISNFEFQSYIRIEYNNLISKKQLLKSFKNKEDAIKYYELLIEDNKHKNIYTLLNDITELMNIKCNELNQRIEKIKNL